MKLKSGCKFAGSRRPADALFRMPNELIDVFVVQALANEDLGAPPPDGLSQDPWLNGMRKPIYVNFVKEGETIATVEALPGDKLADIAEK